MDTVTDYVAAGSFEDIRNNVTYLNEPGYAQLVRTVDLKKKFTNNDSIYVDESAFKYLWRVNLNEECIVLPNIGANIGEVYFVEPSGLPYDNNVLGPNAILLKANEDTYFAFTALNNLTFQKQLFENVGSSGQPKFNKTELKSIQLYMPQNEEQEKIGQYFRDLDHLITLHQRKNIYFYEKVTLVWEQRKFSEFVKNVAVRNKAGVELECYAVTNDRGFISQKEAHDAFGYMADADTTAYNIVPPSSFAYNPARINVGSIGYYTGIENVIVSSLYEVFQTADYVDDRFMWHWFKSDHFSKWIERLQEGSVRLYFYYDKLIQCEMKMPSLEEQKKMGAFFDQLDHLITLHQCKCHLLHKLLHNDWEQRKLGEVLDDMYNGQTPSRKRDEYWNGNIRWLSSGELNRGIVYSSIETITEEGKKSANLRVVPKGTFVMAITGLEASGTRGNCALLGFDTTLNQSCMALFPKQDILISQFLFQWYRMVGEEYGINYTQGTKQQRPAMKSQP